LSLIQIHLECCMWVRILFNYDWECNSPLCNNFLNLI
jgi:hypothetical protein